MKRKTSLCIKRCIDFLSGLCGLVIISPILMIVAVLIKLDSKGPVFFKQERLGLHGHSFKIYKFRTMINNAEQMGSGIRTSEADNRITNIGSILRRTSLDELPQLLNVLKGDMSLVGPRPPVTYHPYKYEDYSEQQKVRFMMRPGITGFAQVEIRNKGTWEDRFVYDIAYVENFSLWLDIKILFKTVFVFANKKAIYNIKN